MMHLALAVGLITGSCSPMFFQKSVYIKSNNAYFFCNRSLAADYKRPGNHPHLPHLLICSLESGTIDKSLFVGSLSAFKEPRGFGWRICNDCFGYAFIDAPTYSKTYFSISLNSLKSDKFAFDFSGITLEPYTQFNFSSDVANGFSGKNRPHFDYEPRSKSSGTLWVIKDDTLISFEGSLENAKTGEFKWERASERTLAKIKNTPFTVVRQSGNIYCITEPGNIFSLTSNGIFDITPACQSDSALFNLITNVDSAKHHLFYYKQNDLNRGTYVALSNTKIMKPIIVRHSNSTFIKTQMEVINGALGKK